MRWFTLSFTLKLLLALLIFGFSFFSYGVEVYYSQHIYPFISNCLRYVTQFFPFSLGDVLYTVFTIYLIYAIVKGVLFLKRSAFTQKQKVFFAIKRLISFSLTIYICFKLVWGLNYNRLGITYQLKIKQDYYCKEDVSNLLFTLIGKANYYRSSLDSMAIKKVCVQNIYNETFTAYKDLPSNYRFLKYNNQAIKNSLYSKWGKYFGFTGYYNPFSGEAQLRYDAPKTILPVVACHEVAHQLGYASETEANFVGFLVAINSPNALFNYSAYLDLILYAQNELTNKYLEDDDVEGLIQKSRELKDCLHPLVKKDIKEIRTFFQQEKTPVSQLSNSIYNQYLKLNNQQKGLKSYDEVVGMVLSYYNFY